MPLAQYISSWNRRRKWKEFLEYIPFTENSTVLDVGFTDIEYNRDDNFLEKNYRHPERITALGIEPCSRFQSRYPVVKIHIYDGKKIPFPDRSFDIVWSNAVLEHAGDRAAQVNLLREIARVGIRAFITTPNKYFPIEVHTRLPLVHFLFPKKWFDGLLKMLGKGWAAGEYMKLLSQKDLKLCLTEAGVNKYNIIKNRLFGFVLDFVIII